MRNGHLRLIRVSREKSHSVHWLPGLTTENWQPITGHYPLTTAHCFSPTCILRPRPCHDLRNMRGGAFRLRLPLGSFPGSGLFRAQAQAPARRRRRRQRGPFFTALISWLSTCACTDLTTGERKASLRWPGPSYAKLCPSGEARWCWVFPKISSCSMECRSKLATPSAALRNCSMQPG